MKNLRDIYYARLVQKVLPAGNIGLGVSENPTEFLEASASS